MDGYLKVLKILEESAKDVLYLPKNINSHSKESKAFEKFKNIIAPSIL
jgi:hypothetical protein